MSVTSRDERRLALKRVLRRMLDASPAKGEPRPPTRTAVAERLGIERPVFSRQLDDDLDSSAPLFDVFELDELLPGFIDALAEELGKKRRQASGTRLDALTFMLKEVSDVAVAAAQSADGAILPSVQENLERQADEACRAIKHVVAVSANHVIHSGPPAPRAVDSSRSSR